MVIFIPAPELPDSSPTIAVETTSVFFGAFKTRAFMGIEKETRDRTIFKNRVFLNPKSTLDSLFLLPHRY